MAKQYIEENVKEDVSTPEPTVEDIQPAVTVVDSEGDDLAEQEIPVVKHKTASKAIVKYRPTHQPIELYNRAYVVVVDNEGCVARDGDATITSPVISINLDDGSFETEDVHYILDEEENTYHD